MKRQIYEPAISKAERQRLKAKVSLFEEKTSYCPGKAATFAEASMDRSPRGGPLYLAWRLLDEARDFFLDTDPGSVGRPTRPARRGGVCPAALPGRALTLEKSAEHLGARSYAFATWMSCFPNILNVAAGTYPFAIPERADQRGLNENLGRMPENGQPLKAGGEGSRKMKSPGGPAERFFRPWRDS